jgi:probable F420-dependent oxidoreductase
LVAKQAAEVDLLSGGRLRLGVGSGWNYVEYEALGANFHDRGKRQEEQIRVMRELWANAVVDFEGRWHRIDRAGLNPRPSRRIPIWLGGGDDRLLRRIGRVGDGWIAPSMDAEKGKGYVERLRSYVREADRDEDSVGIEARAHVSHGPARWGADVEAWAALGATHISVATMDAGLATPDDHIEALRRYREAVG